MSPAADGVLGALVDAIADAVAERLAKQLPRTDAAPPAAPDRWLTMTEAAAHLGMKRKTLEEWRARGVGPKAEKLGRSVRYSRTALDEWVRSGAGKGGV